MRNTDICVDREKNKSKGLNYKLYLEVITPIFIGDGKSLTKKEFAIQSDNQKNYTNNSNTHNKIQIYDYLKLYKQFKSDYEKFMLDSSNLTDFLLDKEVFPELIKYSIEMEDFGVRKSDSILTFMKDQYGKPYIPGSSIKGALRTVILASTIKEQNRDKYGNIDIKKLEIDLFGNETNSLFKYLSISDSKPISLQNLIVLKKVDLQTTGKEGVNKRTGKETSINIARECIKPGTILEFEVSIHEKGSEMFSPANILKAINEFNEEYNKRYVSKFKINIEDNKDIIYIGGGTGFNTKTVNFALFGDEAFSKISSILDSAFQKHNHISSFQKTQVSPTLIKMTRFKGKLLEMGKGRISIK